MTVREVVLGSRRKIRRGVNPEIKIKEEDMFLPMKLQNAILHGACANIGFVWLHSPFLSNSANATIEVIMQVIRKLPAKHHRDG